MLSERSNTNGAQTQTVMTEEPDLWAFFHFPRTPLWGGPRLPGGFLHFPSFSVPFPGQC